MLECVWIEIYVKKSQNDLTGTIYRSPDGSNYLPTCFNNSLHNMLSNVITKSREVTLLGDRNVDHLKKNDNLAIKNIFNLCSFQQIVTKPIRITEYSKTLITVQFLQLQCFQNICSWRNSDIYCRTWYGSLCP